MGKYIAACTTLAPSYPGYVNFSREDDGSVTVTVRGDPQRRDGAYVCGYARDKGQPGRCTPGDDRCNNYCNMAAEKGPMQDSPAPCEMTIEGTTTTVRLSADEWANLLAEASKGE